MSSTDAVYLFFVVFFLLAVIWCDYGPRERDPMYHEDFRPQRKSLSVPLNHVNEKSLIRQKRSLKFQRMVKSRRKRSGGTGAQDYEYNYNKDYDAPGDDDEESKLEKADTKRTRKFVIAGVVLVNAGLCYVCTLCMIGHVFCDTCCRALKRSILAWCDRWRCRDPNYRVVQEEFERLDMKPPTYEQFKVVRDSVGLTKQHQMAA